LITLIVNTGLAAPFCK